MTLDYFRVRQAFDDIYNADASKVLVSDGSPLWGVAPHYLSATEALSFGLGPFAPERTNYFWGDVGKFKPDFATLSGGVITAQGKTIQKFGGLLDEHSIKYPAVISGEQYWSLKPKCFLDLMDYEKSTYRLSSRGALISPKRLLLRRAPEDNIPYFGISHNQTDKPFLIVSSEIKNLYENLNLLGLRFTLAWSENA